MRCFFLGWSDPQNMSLLPLGKIIMSSCLGISKVFTPMPLLNASAPLFMPTNAPSAAAPIVLSKLFFLPVDLAPSSVPRCVAAFNYASR